MRLVSCIAAMAAFVLAGTAGTELSAQFSEPPEQNFAPAPGASQPAAKSAPGGREPHQSLPSVAPGKVALALAARFASDGPFIPRALHWRVYTASKDPAASPALAGETKEAYPVFALSPGDYVVHVTYGLAGATQMVSLMGESRRETLVLPAGGLRLHGRVGEAPLPPQQVRFEVYEGSFLQPGGAGTPTGGRAERPPVIRNAFAGDLVLLPAGVYYVQSTYGEGNAVIQADVRIEPGRLTEATVHHRAAQITLKLVNNRGGEAIANTQWSVLTPGGDSIKESIGAFPSVVLAEGEYVAVARHDGRTFQANFSVESGQDREIEVLAQ
jgi:hypothetical protein